MNTHSVERVSWRINHLNLPLQWNGMKFKMIIYKVLVCTNTQNCIISISNELYMWSDIYRNNGKLHLRKLRNNKISNENKVRAGDYRRLIYSQHLWGMFSQ